MIGITAFCDLAQKTRTTRLLALLGINSANAFISTL